MQESLFLQFESIDVKFDLEGRVLASVLFCQSAFDVLDTLLKCLLELFKIFDFLLVSHDPGPELILVITQISGLPPVLVGLPGILILVPLHLVHLLLELQDLLAVLAPRIIDTKG